MSPTPRPARPAAPRRDHGRHALTVVLAGLLASATVGCATASDGAGGSVPPPAPSEGAASGATDSEATTPTDPTVAAPTDPSTDPPADPPVTDLPVLTIDDFAYRVPALVAPGATVQVRNADVETHTVTSSPAGSFAVSVPVDGSGSFVAPTAPGTYEFVCLLHGGMSGVLTVG